jgi:hypothetical protein
MIAMTVAGGLRLAAQEVKIDYGNQGEPASLDMGGDSFPLRPVCCERAGLIFVLIVVASLFFTQKSNR